MSIFIRTNWTQPISANFISLSELYGCNLLSCIFTSERGSYPNCLLVNGIDFFGWANWRLLILLCFMDSNFHNFLLLWCGRRFSPFVDFLLTYSKRICAMRPPFYREFSSIRGKWGKKGSAFWRKNGQNVRFLYVDINFATFYCYICKRKGGGVT